MIRLAVRCAPERADEVLAELLVLAPNGVEEDRGPGWVEYAIYGGPGEVPELGEVEAAAGDGLVRVSSSQVPDDWGDRWRDFHRPTVIGGRIVVRPPWSDAPDPGGERLDLVIEPGQAFGTGAHATTRMCLELLLELAARERPRGSLADLGTGSGVLAIAAAKLGWAPVAACDHERSALEAARANATANGVEVAFSRCDLRAETPPGAETVVANVTAPLLTAVAARIDRAPTDLICSGLLADEVESVLAAFERAGMELRETRELGEWAALWLGSGPR